MTAFLTPLPPLSLRPTGLRSVSDWAEGGARRRACRPFGAARQRPSSPPLPPLPASHFVELGRGGSTAEAVSPLRICWPTARGEVGR